MFKFSVWLDDLWRAGGSTLIPLLLIYYLFIFPAVALICFFIMLVLLICHKLIFKKFFADALENYDKGLFLLLLFPWILFFLILLLTLFFG